MHIFTYFQPALVQSCDPLCQQVAAEGERREISAGKAWTSDITHRSLWPIRFRSSLPFLVVPAQLTQGAG